MSDTLKEYIVTLHNFENLDAFYNDMETPGGDLYIPNRSVDVKHRRNISRNTHYMLNDAEAETLRNDPRVLAVEQPPSALGIQKIAHWEQTSNFEKDDSIFGNFNNTDKNWGLLRVTEGYNLANWGTNGAFTQTNQTVKTTSSGKNVDVVMVDAHIKTDHPEFAVNSDGTGGSRVQQFNWLSLNSQLGINAGSSNYDYSDISSNHGTHTTGTVAGNTQGWARDANIYYMEFNYTGTFTPGNWELYLYDYIREWHKTKAVNPVTGRRNPTVCNNSWGYSYGDIPLSGITGHTYRGTFTDISGQTDATKKTSLEANGVPVPAGTYLYSMPAISAGVDADVADAIADGVIMVGSAGNSFWPCVKNANANYNNSIRYGVTDYVHSQGSSPARVMICVGNAGTKTQQYKDTSSNYGDRVNIWAPGENIISAVYNGPGGGTPTPYTNTLTDPRDSNYYIASISGTSMSGPQVAGVLACRAEQDPNMTHAEALDYLIDNATSGDIGSTGSDYGDSEWLGDGSINDQNKYLRYIYHRPLNGTAFPHQDHKKRPVSGSVYPRNKVRHKG